MVRQADELERQFGALYNARVAALGVSRTKAPLPEPTVRVAIRPTTIRYSPIRPWPGTPRSNSSAGLAGSRYDHRPDAGGEAMTRILAALVLTIAVGCTNVQPAGPFADRMGRSSPSPGSREGTGRPASASDRPGRQANAALEHHLPGRGIARELPDIDSEVKE